MEKKIIGYLLEKLKKDYFEGHIYREDTIKSCIYHHLKNYYGYKANKYIYTEIRNLLGRNEREKFDLVVSNKALSNGKSITDIKGFEAINFIGEINFILGSLKMIVESIARDAEKISNVEKMINGKFVFFIWERSGTGEINEEEFINEAKRLKEEAANFKNKDERLEKIKQINEFLKIFTGKSKLNIFGLIINFERGIDGKYINHYVFNNGNKELIIKFE